MEIDDQVHTVNNRGNDATPAAVPVENARYSQQHCHSLRHTPEEAVVALHVADRDNCNNTDIPEEDDLCWQHSRNNHDDDISNHPRYDERLPRRDDAVPSSRPNVVFERLDRELVGGGLWRRERLWRRRWREGVACDCGCGAVGVGRGDGGERGGIGWG